MILKGSAILTDTYFRIHTDSFIRLAKPGHLKKTSNPNTLIYHLDTLAERKDE